MGYAVKEIYVTLQGKGVHAGRHAVFLQPMDGQAQTVNSAAAVAHCPANPRWRLSLQTHKLIGLA